jgi:flagellar hook-associated protein 1 FlgK
VPELAQLKAQNLVSLAPANPNNWVISADDAKNLEALRSRFTAPIADVTATVANTIATWANDKSANDAIMKTLNDRRESISGVNLDEEAANMVKFQQLYSASSKILQTSSQMFDTLLAMLS